MKEFLKKIFSSESNASSKRFNGTIGFVIYTLLTIFVVLYDYLKDAILEDTSIVLLKTLIITSAALLGVGGVVEGVKSKLSK